MRAINSGVAVLLWTAAACSGSGDTTMRGSGVSSGNTGGFSGAAGAAGAAGTAGISGAGAVGGSGTGGVGGGAATNGNCEEFYLSAEPGVPNFLIVLDKSGSMGGQDTAMCAMATVDCNDPANLLQPACILGAIGGAAGGVDRWTPSVGALKSLTATLETQMRFGLMTYPGGMDNCGVADLQVSPAYNTAAAIAGAVDAICPGGATPTAIALREAENVFNGLVFNPDEQQGVPYVLLVTDGAPNCAGGGQGGGGFQQGDEQGSYDAVTALADAGIRTYVIGYDTQMDAQLAMVLDEMARRGNTGDTMHRPVEDEASLVTAFTEIAKTAVSCSYKLDMVPADPTFVEVKVDGIQANYDEPDGWSLNGDSIVLQGATCTKLQDGGTHSLAIQVKCTVVVPQ